MGWRQGRRRGEILEDWQRNPNDGVYNSRKYNSGEPIMALEKHYDREGDVLYLTIRRSPFSHATKHRDGLLIDIDRESNKVVGVTVLDYETKFRKLSDLSWIMSLHLPRPLSDFLIERCAP